MNNNEKYSPSYVGKQGSRHNHQFGSTTTKYTSQPTRLRLYRQSYRTNKATLSLSCLSVCLSACLSVCLSVCLCYLWSKDIDSLKNFMSKSIASSTTNEYKLHNMRSFKTQDCTVKFYTTTKKVVIQGSGSLSLTKALSEFLEDETDKSEVEDEATEDNGHNEASQANSINGKVDEFVASVAQIIVSDEESNTCDCSKVKSDLLNVINDMNKVKQDILNITTQNMQSEHEGDLNNLNKLVHNEIIRLITVRVLLIHKSALNCLI